MKNVQVNFKQRKPIRLVRYIKNNRTYFYPQKAIRQECAICENDYWCWPDHYTKICAGCLIFNPKNQSKLEAKKCRTK